MTVVMGWYCGRLDVVGDVVTVIAVVAAGEEVTVAVRVAGYVLLCVVVASRW